MCIMFHMSRLFKVVIDNHLWWSWKFYFYLKSLARQTAKISISESEGDALFFRKKKYFDKGKEKKYDGKGETLN